MDSKPLRILLVEDNSADAQITKRAFQKASYGSDIVALDSGQEALDYLFHKDKYVDVAKYPRPDLILLDLSIPSPDGFEVLSKLKAEKSTRAIPVVVLSGSREFDQIQKSYELGAASYIHKTLDYDSFLKLIEYVLTYWKSMTLLPR